MTVSGAAKTGFSLGYLPALDGLRALAVTSVVLLHFHAPFLPGGFLGVDVFFVLSGFLITCLILSEWESRGAISLGRFYLGRALRLLPALLVVLIVVSPFVTKQHLGLTIAYVANWFMASGAQMGLLNHIWSLAIEEQFYILWPLTLVVLLRWGTPRWVILAIPLTIAGGVAVLRAALALTGAPWHRLYYGTDTRIDALLIGCAAAMVTVWCGHRVREYVRRWGTVAAPTAAIAILGATILFSVEHTALYVGGMTVIAGLVAIILLDVVVGPGRWFHPILTAQPLVAIGRISYGIYLWHHIFAYALAPLQWPVSAAIGVPFTLLCAATSFLVVERPILSLKNRLRPRT